jgi:hypothetical protein
MAYGVGWSEDHADITNHYLGQGVKGGLPLMFLFIMLLWCGFLYVGQALRGRAEASTEEQFLIWATGAALFAHAATCTSVAYFDQSFLFLYLNLAIIVSLRSTAKGDTEDAVVEKLAVETRGDPEPVALIVTGSDVRPLNELAHRHIQGRSATICCSGCLSRTPELLTYPLLKCPLFSS